MSPRASCESVLSSSAAKLGPISMADVGFGYFAGGLVVSCMVPAVQGGTVAVLSVLRWLSVLALPYTLFSIGFQALRARLWCPLCVLVQAVLWAQAVALLEVPLAWHVSSSAVWVTLALFPLPGLAWLAIKPSVEAGVEARTRRIQLERLLRDPAILSARIGREAPIPLPPLPLEVTRGPASAPLTVTLYTDPTCPHCAVRHREALEALSRADGALRAVVRLQGPMTADPRAVALLATVAEHLERGAEAEAYELVDRWYTGDRSALTLIQSDALTANARARFESHRERMRPPPFDAVPRIFVGDRPWPAELSLRYIGYLARALAEAAST